MEFPNSATGFDQRAEADLEELAGHPRVVAIGETGLDFFRDRAPVEDQRRAFAAQIRVARRTGLPLVMMIGIVLVALCAACALIEDVVTITSTFSRTNS